MFHWYNSRGKRLTVAVETKWTSLCRRHFQTHCQKNANVCISMKIPLKFVPKGPINDIPVLVQIMAWRRSSDRPSSEPLMVKLRAWYPAGIASWIAGTAVLGPCLTTATRRCRKNFSQWERSFHWKLRCHWLEFLRQRQIAAVTQGPGTLGTGQVHARHYNTLNQILHK